MEKKPHHTNFIKNIIEEDLRQGKNNGYVVTRFPPEPNGYLHIGHAKSICLNFGLAQEYPKARCHLRFDDTNPEKEKEEYAEAIKEDVRWLGFDWGQHLYYASDYYQKLYEYAVELIKQGKAYVCSLSAEEMRAYRGTLTEPGRESPYRNRSVEENLDLFERMKAGEFKDGEHTLRAKIDMASGNLNMRDPAIYRIKRAHHWRTGDQWCIYPMYDFAHCISDALEGITHSLCTLEFEDHRPLYDWFLDQLNVPCHPQQIEFARLELNYTVTSKRKLLMLVEKGIVDGWDDPRMPTIQGMRRRGFTASGIRKFCDQVGVSKSQTTIDFSVLEECIRDDLNETAPRAFAVLRPLKVVIENYPEDKRELLRAPKHPQKPELGERQLIMSRELYIEQDDFMEYPPKKYFRLAPGQEVRLRYSYVIKCEKVIKNDRGEVIELRCSYDPETLGKNPTGRKVKGIIHWLSAQDAVSAEVRLYDRLFSHPEPWRLEKEGGTFTDGINKNSLEVITHAWIEPSLVAAQPEERFQFERLGYFVRDRRSEDRIVFNRALTLKDSWAKVQEKSS